LFVIVGEFGLTADEYARRFEEEGVSLVNFRPDEFREWVATVADVDLGTVEGFLLGDIEDRQNYPKMIRERSKAPIIAMNATPSLEQTLDLFAAGVDDVVRKPVHVPEILARVYAIKRRHEADRETALAGETRGFFDGRDPEVGGKTLSLPRGERRILEFLVKNRGHRVSKAQIFNSIYGIFDESFEEKMVEAHISKLRSRLHARLGYDPLNSVRYLGYLDEATGGNSAPTRRGHQRDESYGEDDGEYFEGTAPFAPLFQVELTDGDRILEEGLRRLKKTAEDLAEVAEARTGTVAQLAAHRDRIDRTQSETRLLLEALVGTG
jgi:CheY-like chemotaxis protein